MCWSVIIYNFKMIQITRCSSVRQYAVVIIANLSVMCVGFGLAWPSPVLVKLADEKQSPLSRPVTDSEAGWIVSIGSLCATVVIFLPAYLVDRIGRKNCIILACIPKVLVGLIFSFATEVWMLLLGRSINGVIDLLIFTVVPMYASEIASKEVRGALGTILQICSSFGIMAMLSLGPFVPYVPLNVVFTCVAAVTTVPIFFLPDSPYFLYSKGRKAESLEVLTYLRGSETLANDELEEYIATNTDVKIDKCELFKNKIFLKSLGIVIILGAGTQLVGFNAVSFYLQTILESTHTSIRSEIASVIVGSMQLLASCCTPFVTDRFGRKPILTSTLIGMALGMIGLGTFFKLRESETSLSGLMNFVPLGSLILVVFCYSGGCGSLYWILSTELFEGPARGVGVSFGLFTSIFLMFLTTAYFPTATLSIGPAATYWACSVNCVLLCLFILFCVPETKGKTFAEIQESLGAKRENDLEVNKF